MSNKIPKNIFSEEAKLKAKNTRENSVKQLAIPEEQETHLLLDYFSKTLKLYTTKATVMNRLARMECEYTEQATYDGEIFSRSYEVPFEEMGKFLKVGVFGVNSKKDNFEDWIWKGDLIKAI